MSRGLGVMRYCSPEGGSGFITNPSLPWLPTYEPTQLAPVYDQNPGWLRNSRPGTFTYYPQFSEAGMPQPVDIGCNGGMGDLTLLRSDVVAPMPSITTTARQGCTRVNTCPSAFESWIENNPWLAAGLGVIGGYLLFGGKK